MQLRIYAMVSSSWSPNTLSGAFWNSDALWRQIDGGRLGCNMLLARRVAVGAPRWHGTLPRPLDAVVRINASGKRQFTGSALVGVCTPRIHAVSFPRQLALASAMPLLVLLSHPSESVGRM
jgi:hypothetical protein